MNEKSLKHPDRIFEIKTGKEFDALALEIFRFQATHNPIYSKYLELLNISAEKVKAVSQIPFLPISFFKTHQILCEPFQYDKVFESSGTTGQINSKHYIANLRFYEKSFKRAFEIFFGKPEQYCFLALLPSYLERENSSLVYMVKKLIESSSHPTSGFFLDDYADLFKKLRHLAETNQPAILIGVSFALLDFSEQFPIDLKNIKIMETGGMKGRREEITREELHDVLKKAFQVEKIYSEYGMTELMSQAYLLGDEFFNCPPWMKILIRDPRDPFSILSNQETGGINIIDLANIHSCCFIETSDLGKINSEGKFEVVGRMETSEMRGCNLLIQ